MSNSRRAFLKTSSVSLLSLAIPESLADFFSSKEKLRIGLISDLHVDVIHDGKERLQLFLDQMKLEKPDALIQMGDFAIPKPENFQVIENFNSAHAHTFHVLGNHDMDEGFSKASAAKAYGMPAFYYSKDLGDIKLIVLDGNDSGGPTKQGVYDSYIGPNQQVWLIEEFENTAKPVVIVSHQPIAGIYPIVNSLEIQSILSRFSSKILLAINGHAHVDQHIIVGGVNYVHINSASYYWVGEKLAHESLTPEIHQTYPSLQFTCPYMNPLFSLLMIDPKSRTISIQGRKTEWIGPSPIELGYSILTESDQKCYVQPRISKRKI
ncbi:metallophosphoesterase family protein [Algoriphagus sp.]|uniref:metallophosphoesterase family protein n=1 Tax=Algoriphagus sp. TaxID=1872435 RepID=UPI00391C84D6